MEEQNEEWVEILLPNDNDEWPEPEIENKFNWSLSMFDIDRKYKLKARISNNTEHKYEAKSVVGQYLERQKVKAQKFLNPNALMYNKHSPVEELTLEEFRDKIANLPEPNFNYED